jgi:hypothetical protein
MVEQRFKLLDGENEEFVPPGLRRPRRNDIGPKKQLTMRPGPVVLAVVAGVGGAARQFFYFRATERKSALQPVA